MSALLKMRATAWAAAVALVLVPLAGVAPAAADDVPPTAETAAQVAGTPTISGTPRVGEVLTVDPGVWTPEAAFAYQWARDGVAIAEATGATYALTAADAGTSLTATVTGTVDGLEPTVVTSEPTATVELGLFASSAEPTVEGTAQVGAMLTATTTDWTPAATFAYQWLREGVAIEGATASTYSLVPGDLGAAISVRVTGSADGYEPLDQTSPATTPVSAASFVTTPVPTIAGTAQVGRTLTANAGTWSPAATFTYQWYRSGAAISGATKSTYALASADLAKSITVQVTGTAAGYTSTARTSSETAPVVAGTITPTVPTISGTAQVGKTLTVVPGTWSPAATFTYQWYRSGAAISGATKSTYALAAADLGKAITVKITGASAGYTTVAKTSAATAAVKVGALAAPVPVLSAPRVGAKTTVALGAWTAGTTFTYQWFIGGKTVTGTRGTYPNLIPSAAERGLTITVKVTGTKAGYTTVGRAAAGKTIGYGVFTAATPKITGTARVGQTLTVSRGTWTPAASAYTYQWRAEGTAVAGATGTSFKLTSAQRGKTITVTVTGKLTSYATKAVTSAATAVVLQAFTTTPLPTISGTVAVGKTLTATPGTWTPAAAFAYQWRANGVAIAGATGATFTLTDAQWGKTITVLVTGRRTNYVTTPRTSAATTVVVKSFSASPAPTISGTVRVSSTLTAVNGTWSPAATFTYQWKANGVAIAGATSSTFKLTTAQYGKTITVSVSGKATNYATATRTSAATAAVLWPVGISTPKITSQPVEDITMSGEAATFEVVATGGGLSYQWQVSADDGKTWTNMAGRTASTLTFTTRSSYSLNQYRVIVKNMVKSVTSSAADLYVNSTLADPYKPNKTAIQMNWATWTGPSGRWAYDSTRDVVAAYATACYFGDGYASPSTDLAFAYIGSNGTAYASARGFGDDDIWTTSSVSSNGCVDFAVYAFVPRSVVAGGVWRVTDSSEPEVYTDVQYVDGA
ncbi:hypothetical protein [Xylanimonas sp. McL0601]|uniref:hypothetical protein n=1 Tax=Xylanimonas sp. McL0601 TaxID=3414739 RepID=UPI003CF3960E